MNIKLSKKQQTYLTYLSLGAHVDICTSVGRALGNLNSNDSKISGCAKATLNSLYAWGLLNEEERYDNGMRWSRLTISNKGRELLANLEASNV